MIECYDPDGCHYQIIELKNNEDQRGRNEIVSINGQLV